MEITEFAHQALPDLALIATAPQGHANHKQDQGQGRAEAYPPHFAGPGLTFSHTALNHLRGVDLTQHRHAHLFAHLVINVHFTSSVHRKLLGFFFFLSGSMPDRELSCLLFPPFVLK